VGILAPARTSPEIVDYLAREMAKVAAQPEFRERFERVGLDLVTDSSPAAFAAYIKSETENWSRQIKAAGIQPE